MVKRHPGASRRNPFEFGGEARRPTLVDRTDELDVVTRTMESGGTLFLIGPRRYGKTSILRVVEHRLAGSEVTVLRFDAEAYETIDGLAAAILAAAAQRLACTLEKAGDLVKRWFAQLRPDVAYDLAEQKITVRFGVVPAAEAAQNLVSAAALTRRGIAPSTMHKTLRALDDRGLIRDDQQSESVRYRSWRGTRGPTPRRSTPRSESPRRSGN